MRIFIYIYIYIYNPFFELVIFHKWVLNAMTVPNPTQMSKSGKCKVKSEKMFVFEMKIYLQFRICSLYFVAIYSARVAIAAGGAAG